MNLPNYFEVKPKAKQNAILLSIICIAFSVSGVFLILSGDIKTVLAGFLVIVFFGGGGFFVIPKLLQRPISMILNHEGLKQITPSGTSFICWKDIESIGIARIYGNNKMIGLRLITYDNYINSMSPELIDYFIKIMPSLKLVALGTSLLDFPNSLKLWSVLENRPNPVEALRSFGKVGNLVEVLLWNRKSFGYDICLAWSELDRPASEFISLLEQFHTAYRI
jgi:hypothetical protein